MKILNLKLFCLLAALMQMQQLYALEQQGLNHSPPFSSTGLDRVTLNIAAGDLKRARVLVQGRQGYRIFDMNKNGAQFEADVNFAELSLLRYHFQCETQDGRLFESEQYEIRQSSDEKLESEYRDLKKENGTLKAKITQIESKLFNLKSVKAEDLAKNKNAELARALLLVGEKEKELAQLKEQNR